MGGNAVTLFKLQQQMTKKDSMTPKEPRSPSMRRNGAKFLRSLTKRNNHSPATPKQQQRESAIVPMDTASSERTIQEQPVPPHARTAILTSYDPLMQKKEESHGSEAHTLRTLSDEAAAPAAAPQLAIPPRQPWFNFTLCARPSDVYDENIDCSSSSSSSETDLPDDPTVQESFECVFAHQLEEEEEAMTAPPGITSPAALLQSRTPSRSLSFRSTQPRPYHNKSLVHLGTYDPVVGRVIPPPFPKIKEKIISSDASQISLKSTHQCCCQRGVRTPQVPPEFWPQRPLMMRPTPGGGVKILGIRFSSCTTYLWRRGDAQDCILWSKLLHHHWNAPYTLPEKLPACCPECMILPINNGNEPKGESLVVDFESNIFRGTMLVRVRYAEGTTQQPYDDSKGYFKGMNRRYQIVIRGHFLEEIPVTQCVAGIQLERPVGNLPPKWIMNGALKVISFFAPQLKADVEGKKPYSVSPFGSTPQTLRIDDHAECDETMEEMHHEPIHDHHTLMGKASKHHSSLHRARWRKRHFDKLYVEESLTPVTMPQKIYTFEFLQHMLNMQDFTIELGSMLGHVELGEALDGQPLQIMARHEGSHNIWCFDIWHEMLYEDSKRHNPILDE